MGGFGSGRYGGRPLTGQCLYLELGWMLKTGRAKDGAHIDNVLSWHCGGEESGSVRCSARMDQPGRERLELSWRLISTGEQMRQTINLDYTEPNYGGSDGGLCAPIKAIARTSSTCPTAAASLHPGRPIALAIAPSAYHQPTRRSSACSACNAS